MQSSGTGTSGATSSNGTSSTVQTDLTSLGQALSSGDLNAAQSAFAKLRSDMQAARVQGMQVQGAHHGRHHHHHAARQSSSTDSSATSATTSATGSTLNLLA